MNAAALTQRVSRPERQAPDRRDEQHDGQVDDAQRDRRGDLREWVDRGRRRRDADARASAAPSSAGGLPRSSSEVRRSPVDSLAIMLQRSPLGPRRRNAVPRERVEGALAGDPAAKRAEHANPTPRHRRSTLTPPTPAEGFEHLPAGSLDVLRWLAGNNVEFVLVGAVARAVRGDRKAIGRRRDRAGPLWPQHRAARTRLQCRQRAAAHRRRLAEPRETLPGPG